MFENIKNLFNGDPKKRLAEMNRKDFMEEWLEHIRQSNQPEPDFEMRLWMNAFISKLENEEISLFRTIEQIRTGVEIGVEEWCKEFEEKKNLTVTEYAKNCQRKFCLGSAFPGTYTVEEMVRLNLSSQANIYGLTLEEYLQKLQDEASSTSD